MRISEPELEVNAAIVARDVLGHPAARRFSPPVVSIIASVAHRDEPVCTTPRERQILRAALEAIDAAEIASSWSRGMPP